MFVRAFVRAVLCLALAASAGCRTADTGAPVASPAATTEPVAVATPLAPVDALPKPTLPPWVVSISPLGETTTLAQIRVIFQAPLIPLEALEAPERQQQLAKFALDPPLPGHFRFLTPRMVGFQADRALPKATRLRVTLTAGLADLQGHALASDLAWTFTTEPVRLAGIPGMPTKDEPHPHVDPGGVRPKIGLTSNVPLDEASLAQHAFLVADGGPRIALSVAPATAGTSSPSPARRFDPSADGTHYDLVPATDLAKAKQFALEIEPGVRPASGNLASGRRYSGVVRTYAPLALDRTENVGLPNADGAAARFSKGTLQLDFNNGLDAASAASAVSVSPAPSDAKRLVSINDGDTTIGLNPNVLAPNTHYSVRIDGSLRDVFGQTLGSAGTAEFTTSDIAPDFWAPSGAIVFPAGSALQLDASGTNLARGYSAAYRVVQPLDLVFTDTADRRTDGYNLLPDLAQWSSHPLTGAKNASATAHVPLRAVLGSPTGMLAYGLSAKTFEYVDNGKSAWFTPTYTGLVQITNLGVFAQWFPASGFVRVAHLSDGSPAQANVDVYASRLSAKERSDVAPCASGRTGNDGLWRLDTAAMTACLAATEDRAQSPALLAVAHEGGDWAYARTQQGGAPYQYGVYASWPGAAPLSRGTMYSDRELYQPGETAWFTGAAYYVDRGRIVRDAGRAYTLTLGGPKGEKRALGSATPDAFGIFSIKYTVPKNAGLGYWSVTAKAANGNEFGGSFRIAEFKPPNFKTDVSLPAEFAVAGATLQATGKSTYLFGAPVGAGVTEWTVTRSRAYFTPKGWDAFVFGPDWFWPQEPPSVPPDVLQTAGTTDAGGASSQPVTVATDLPYPMRYEVALSTTDAANVSVADTKSFTALPGDALIGVKAPFVASAGQAAKIDVVVTDAKGAAVSGKRVTVVLQSMTYASATQLIEGGETARNAVKYDTVATAETTSSGAAQSVSLTAPKPGSYRIRANFADAKTDATASDTQLFVSGEGAADWGNDDPTRLTLKLDKKTYAPGDTATVLIESPFPEADLHLSVVRSGEFYRTTIHTRGAAPKVTFRVTEAMLPNAAVEAVLVRRGAPLAKTSAVNLPALAQTGFAPFSVDVTNRVLSVAVVPQFATPQPSAQQHVEVSVHDARGAAVRGALTVIVANDAVLQLSGYRPPKLGDTVFAEQPLETNFADGRTAVVLKALAEPAAKGWGFGGGFLAGAEGTRVRTNFQPLAFYAGSIKTDANGHANVSFPLPDDLTTWRVMVVASASDLRFGNGEATFVATKPLLANPVLPQFARPGDRFDGGFAVTQPAGTSGTLTVTGSLEGALGFASSDPHALATSVPVQPGTQAYRFPMIAGPVGTARVGFSVKLANAADAFAVPFELRVLPVNEGVVESGTTQDRVTIPFAVGPNVARDVGGLDVSMASTLLPEILVPAQHVLDAQPYPFLDDAASRLAIAADAKILAGRYQQSLGTLAPVPAARDALRVLATLQRADGGFAAYPQAQASSVYASTFAAQALGRAAVANVPVDAAMLKGVRAFLGAVLTNPSRYAPWCKTPSCVARYRIDALLALGALGDARTSFLGDVLGREADLPLDTRVRLARYLLRFPEWSAQAATLAAKLEQSVYQTGRTASVNPSGDDRYASTVAVQADVLSLEIERKAPTDTIDRAVRALLALRTQGTWGGAYDTARALDALVAYAGLQPTPPSFVARVELDARTLDEHTFSGYRDASSDLHVPAARLAAGKHSLALSKNGKGTLHYVAAYRYGLNGPQPGALNGLRITRRISLAGSRTPLATFGLAMPAATTIFTAGTVYEVALELIADHPVSGVVITDPLPAGFEAVDTSFRTAAPVPGFGEDSRQIDYQSIYRDRILAYASRLDAGVYTVRYLVRSVTPGTFAWPGGEAHVELAPEEFGRTAATSATIVSK